MKIKAKLKIGDEVKLYPLASDIIGDGPYKITGKKLSEYYGKGKNSRYEYQINGDKWVNGYWIK